MSRSLLRIGLAFLSVAVAGCGRIGYEDHDADIDGGGVIDAATDGGGVIDAATDGAASDADIDGGGVIDAATDDAASDGGGTGTVRPLAPWSTGAPSRARPTFRFALGGAADTGRVEICRDRACATVFATFEGPGSAVPPVDLPRTGSGTFFWRVTPLALGAVSGAPSAVWSFMARYAWPAGPDSSMFSQLDLDGDGFAEIAIGAPDAGEVRIIAGSSSGPSASRVWTVPGPARFGASLASAGDTDGDGVGELVIGSPGEGAIVIARVVSDAIETVRIAGPSATGGFGHAVATLGDVNGDGYSDVAVGAPLEGRTYVLHGGPGGLGATPTQIIVGTGEHGHALAGGDFDGDGFGDLAIAIPDQDRVDVHFGSATGLGATPRVVLAGAAGSRFGQSIAGNGDLTFDGRSDLAVGAPVGAGVVQVHPGASDGLEVAPRWTLDETPATFGASVAIAFDTDLNGYDDLLTSDADGSVWLYYARSAGIGSSPGWSPQLATPAGALRWGAGMGSAGFVDGDRYGDFAIGAPGSSSVSYFRGGGGVMAAATFTGAAGSGFGAAIARP